MANSDAGVTSLGSDITRCIVRLNVVIELLGKASLVLGFLGKTALSRFVGIFSTEYRRALESQSVDC